MEEWKIGEIRQVNGEWYQCVKGTKCYECAFAKKHCNENPLFEAIGSCSKYYRKDATSVIFKKLKKVGLPYYNSDNKLCQEYKCYIVPLIIDDIIYVLADNRVVIEVKQNKKEDMEEKKVPLKKEDIYFLCSKFNQIVKYCVIHGYDEDNIQHEFEKLFLIAEESDIKSNLRPFDLEAAKADKPVCTRDGRKARIICFDVKAKKPIAALITNDDTEEAHFYYDNGRSDQYQEYRYDLMMLPEKKEGWINIYDDMVMYESEEEAKIGIATERNYIATAKVEWEE